MTTTKDSTRVKSSSVATTTSISANAPALSVGTGDASVIVCHNDPLRATRSSGGPAAAGGRAGGPRESLQRRHLMVAGPRRLINAKKQLLIKKAMELKSKCIRGHHSRLIASRGGGGVGLSPVVKRTTRRSTESRGASADELARGGDEEKLLGDKGVVADGPSKAEKRIARTLERRQRAERRHNERATHAKENCLNRSLATTDSTGRRISRERSSDNRSKSCDSRSSATRRERSSSSAGAARSSLSPATVRSRRGGFGALRIPLKTSLPTTTEVPASPRIGQHDKTLASPVMSPVALAARKKSRLAKLVAMRPKQKISRLLTRCVAISSCSLTLARYLNTKQQIDFFAI